MDTGARESAILPEIPMAVPMPAVRAPRVDGARPSQMDGLQPLVANGVISQAEAGLMSREGEGLRAVDACEWPGCDEPALCSSGNFGGKLVCAEHFKITNGFGVDEPRRASLAACPSWSRVFVDRRLRRLRPDLRRGRPEAAGGSGSEGPLLMGVPVFYAGNEVGALQAITMGSVSVNWTASAPVPPSLDVQVEIQVDRCGNWLAVQLRPPAEPEKGAFGP